MTENIHPEKALLEQYVLGLLTDEESQQIEQYLSKNPAVAKEVADSQSIMKSFAIEYTIDSSKKNQRQILTKVEDTKIETVTKPKLKSSWILKIAVILALSLMAFLLYQQQINL